MGDYHKVTLNPPFIVAVVSAILLIAATALFCYYIQTVELSPPKIRGLLFINQSRSHLAAAISLAQSNRIDTDTWITFEASPAPLTFLMPQPSNVSSVEYPDYTLYFLQNYEPMKTPRTWQIGEFDIALSVFDHKKDQRMTQSCLQEIPFAKESIEDNTAILRGIIDNEPEDAEQPVTAVICATNDDYDYLIQIRGHRTALPIVDSINDSIKFK